MAVSTAQRRPGAESSMDILRRRFDQEMDLSQDIFPSDPVQEPERMVQRRQAQAQAAHDDAQQRRRFDKEEAEQQEARQALVQAQRAFEQDKKDFMEMNPRMMARSSNETFVDNDDDTMNTTAPLTGLEEKWEAQFTALKTADEAILKDQAAAERKWEADLEKMANAAASPGLSMLGWSTLSLLVLVLVC